MEGLPACHTKVQVAASHKVHDVEARLMLCWCLQVHSMVTKLAQFTDIRAALIVGGLSLNVQAATLRTSPEILVATPVSPLPALKHSFGCLIDPHTLPAHLPRDPGGHTGKSSPCSSLPLDTEHYLCGLNKPYSARKCHGQHVRRATGFGCCTGFTCQSGCASCRG